MCVNHVTPASRSTAITATAPAKAATKAETQQSPPSDPPNPARGSLILVVGASGCGKDSLLVGARKRLETTPGFVFSHRYITRPANAGGENHIALSEADFAARERAGLFLLHWDSHGLRYALGREVDSWLDAGLCVVANGSRAHLPMARQHIPDLQVIEISVSADVLRERLLARGREHPDAIERRIARTQAIDPSAFAEINHRITNDAALEQGIDALTDRLLAIRDRRNGLTPLHQRAPARPHAASNDGASPTHHEARP